MGTNVGKIENKKDINLYIAIIGLAAILIGLAITIWGHFTH